MVQSRLTPSAAFEPNPSRQPISQLTNLPRQPHIPHTQPRGPMRRARHRHRDALPLRPRRALDLHRRMMMHLVAHPADLLTEPAGLFFRLESEDARNSIALGLECPMGGWAAGCGAGGGGACRAVEQRGQRGDEGGRVFDGGGEEEDALLEGSVVVEGEGYGGFGGVVSFGGGMRI